MLNLWFHNMAESNWETDWLENDSNKSREELLQTWLSSQM